MQILFRVTVQWTSLAFGIFKAPQQLDNELESDSSEEEVSADVSEISSSESECESEESRVEIQQQFIDITGTITYVCPVAKAISNLRSRNYRCGFTSSPSKVLQLRFGIHEVTARPREKNCAHYTYKAIILMCLIALHNSQIRQTNTFTPSNIVNAVTDYHQWTASIALALPRQHIRTVSFGYKPSSGSRPNVLPRRC
eukprot:scaffold33025_cov73-Cyclotella_meneghiniana.AAC.4